MPILGQLQVDAAVTALKLKRMIDASNQDRTDTWHSDLINYT